MILKIFQSAKIQIAWIILLWLGQCPQLSLAATAPLSTPVVPVQTSSTAPLEVEQSASQNVEIKEFKGEVGVKRLGSDQFENIQSGVVLRAGDSVKTEDGSCHLLINGKNDVYLGPRTVMKITETSRNDRDKTDSTRLSLDNGRLKVMLSKLKKGSTFQVETPTAVATVRGTIFYLNAGFFLGQNSTQLYVDKTHGGVLFKNTITGKSFTVGPFSMSGSFEDGKLNAPQRLSSEQRDAFVKNWENPSSTMSQQFGVEEIPNPAAVNPGTSGNVQNLLNKNEGPLINDARQDKISEQNVPGANGFPEASPSPIVSPSSEPSPSPSQEPFPTPSTEPSPIPSAEPSPTPSVEPSPTPSAEPSPTPSVEPSPTPSAEPSPGIDAQEQTMIRQEIALIRFDQDLDHADANLARIADAQTGKVFTDVFGNRVRTDQYIFHVDASDTVQFLSLTARTGQYQNGVSALWFTTIFNRSFASDVSIKSLPWNDYMNVVTREDMAAKLGISPGTDAFNALYPEYIVHEHRPELTQGDSALYPIVFDAIFISPLSNNFLGQGIIAIADAYSPPFPMDIPVGDGIQSIPVQGKVLDILSAIPFQGTSVARVETFVNGQTLVSFGGPSQPKTDGGGSGSQTASFAENFDTSKLLDINYYRNLAINNDGNPNNDEHPAYFDEPLNPRLASDFTTIGQNHLIGGFIPINDKGRIIDQPGFRVRGVRELLSPNPLVNGGNYNLEVLLLYGYVDDANSFHEDIRIDTIITSGIFQGVGHENSPGDKNFSSTVNNSALFPAALHPDDDDTSQQI